MNELRLLEEVANSLGIHGTETLIGNVNSVQADVENEAPSVKDIGGI
jgi:hypothetical protein